MTDIHISICTMKLLAVLAHRKQAKDERSLREAQEVVKQFEGLLHEKEEAIMTMSQERGQLQKKFKQVEEKIKDVTLLATEEVSSAFLCLHINVDRDFPVA